MARITETKELTITPPEGYVIDESKSTFTNIVFKKIPKEDKLPTKWEDLKIISGFLVAHNCDTRISNNYPSCDQKLDNRNVFATEEQAQASIALAQLSQLKKAYNGDWEPDWLSNEEKYCIFLRPKDIYSYTAINSPTFLAFKTAKLRDEFLKNFKDLIEQAKPLLG